MDFVEGKKSGKKGKMLLQRNTPYTDCVFSPAGLLFGWPVKDFIPSVYAERERENERERFRKWETQRETHRY